MIIKGSQRQTIETTALPDAHTTIFIPERAVDRPKLAR